MRSRRAVPAGQARRASCTSRTISGGAVASGTNGGGLLVGLLTSERVATVTPTAIPAAAAAAAPTRSQTRSRGLIRNDGIPASRRYISESDAVVPGTAAAGALRDLGAGRLARTRARRRRSRGRRRRSRAGRVGRRPHPRRGAHPARLSRVANRTGGAASLRTGLALLLRRQPLRVRGKNARGDGLRGRRLARRWLHRLEAQRVSDRAPIRPRRAAARALQPPPPDPRGRRAGSAEAARL